MTSAFINGVTFKRGDGEASEAFTTVGEILSMSGIGKANPLVEVTSFDSTAREYIAGLADGTEVALECNYLPANTAQQGLVSDVDAGTTRNIQVAITDGVTPKTYSFAVTPLAWVLNPSFDDKNSISFTLKISGAITVT